MIDSKIGVIAAAAIAAMIGSVAIAAENYPGKDIKPTETSAPLPELTSGYWFRTEETKALQDDDFDNPGFLWVETGERLWNTADGEANKSCADCHNDAETAMKGVRASFPKIRDNADAPVTLEQQINLCRTQNQKAKEWKWESEDLLAMTSYIGLQSRGMPMNVDASGRMAPFFEKGKEIYYTRYGQLDMSCASCHENNYGQMMRADHISQGHTNGFPTYRLKWQGIGSVHRRFRGCNEQIRATKLSYGHEDYVNLEVYLAARGNGLPVETPAVRQ